MLDFQHFEGELAVINEITSVFLGQQVSLFAHIFASTFALKECRVFALVLQSSSTTNSSAKAIPDLNKSVSRATAPCGSIDFEDPLKFLGHLWFLPSVESIPIGSAALFAAASGSFFSLLVQVQQLLEKTIRFSILLLLAPTRKAWPDILLYALPEERCCQPMS